MKRNKEIKIRLTDDELNDLNKAVAKTGLSREEYLRTLIKKIVPANKLYPDLIETIKQLRMIGNNINQLAVIAHKTGSIDVLKYRNDFEKIQKQINYIIKTNQEYRNMEDI